MKLKFEIAINAGQDAVWAAFDNPDNLRRWRHNLQSVTLVSGQHGQPGAVSEFVYGEGGKKIVMKEAITERAAPNFVAAVYSTEASKTLIVNHFESAGEGTTRWTSWLNVKFRGLMRLTALFAVRAIREQMEADMARFKLMVETDEAGA